MALLELRKAPSGPRASFGARLVAAIIDGLVVGVAGVFLRLIAGPVGGKYSASS